MQGSRRGPHIPCLHGERPPIMAVVLSCILIGAAQLNNRQPEKAILLIAGTLLAAIPTAGMGMFAALIIAIFDGWRISEKLNRGETVGKWEWF